MGGEAFDGVCRAVAFSSDVRVEFEGSATGDASLGLNDYLENFLVRPVDLVTEEGRKARA